MWLKNFIKYKNQRTPLRFLIVTVVFQQFFHYIVAKTFLPKAESLQNDNGMTIFSHGGGHRAAPGSPEFWNAIFIATLCVCGAGFCSGLTVGYLSIEELDLQLAIQGRDEKKKKYAQNILPVIQQHHILLSTLLVANALFMESLPIYLHKIMSGLAAVIFSTLFVVLFGEIIPQAFCTGPNQLAIANFCIPMTKMCIFIFYIICKPIALGLDWYFGVDHKFLFPKNDLKALINIHKGNIFTHGQYKLMQSLFDLRTDSVTKQMVPIEKVFSLSYDEIITKDLIKKVKAYGYSMIPIYKGNKQNIVYVMKSKRFLQCDSQVIGKKIKNRFKTEEILIIKKSASMLDMLMQFQSSKQTFSFIADEVEIKSKPKTANDYLSGIQSQRYVSQNEQHGYGPKFVGIITIKDVFEEILDQQLVDEDLHKDQQIEIEQLKQEKKRLKQEKKQYENQIQNQQEQDENEEELAILQQKEEEYLKKLEEFKELEKKYKSKKKKNQKQQQLIDNANIKQLKQNIQNDNELQEMGGSFKRKNKGNDLDEPLLNAREKISM